MIELLLVLAVMGVLSSMAVPNYQRVMAQREVDQATLQLRDHFELARTYAQTHQTQVSVCPVSSAELNNTSLQCTNTPRNWQAWMVQTEDGIVLARSYPLVEGLNIDSKSREDFVFNKRGGVNGDNGSVALENTQTGIAKSVVISSDGRIQLYNCNRVKDSECTGGVKTN